MKILKSRPSHPPSKPSYQKEKQPEVKAEDEE
jgi:hypothetical protein